MIAEEIVFGMRDLTCDIIELTRSSVLLLEEVDVSELEDPEKDDPKLERDEELPLPEEVPRKLLDEDPVLELPLLPNKLLPELESPAELPLLPNKLLPELESPVELPLLPNKLLEEDPGLDPELPDENWLFTG